ncbi:DNA polymerase ligase N-terminal domain-containing protein [Variovorax sp. WS11]|uniref:DNA polymerase ligase N-terminal domain-containing protein n=1 Tax=Variovorax sp. WS11 TaxID=1105204 RepID=UPI002158FDBF|nr:DNA polymerase ligase N-terminal domain-containing protein [Variovorax sp. WS11]
MGATPACQVKARRAGSQHGWNGDGHRRGKARQSPEIRTQTRSGSPGARPLPRQTRFHQDRRTGWHPAARKRTGTRPGTGLRHSKALGFPAALRRPPGTGRRHGTFEGDIPKGEYGGGTVIVWDRGIWEPVGNPREGLAKRKLIFKLHGQKLAGLWEFVRISKPGDKKQEQWMFLKKRADAWARPSTEYDVIAALPDSVMAQPLGLVEERDPHGTAAPSTAPRRARLAPSQTGSVTCDAAPTTRYAGVVRPPW